MAGDDPLRIAMISYYLPSESKIGVGYQVHALATALADRGHDVTVLSACAPVPGARYGHRLVRPRGSLRTFRFATQLRRARPVRRTTSCTPTATTTGCGGVGPAATSAPSTARASRRRCTSAARWSGPAWCCSGSARCWPAWSPTSTVLVSPATRRWTPWVSTVIPNGVSLPDGPGRHAARPTHPVVLFVGTWEGRKRGRVLAEAFVEHVLPALPDAELWMVSRDVPDDVHPSVKALGRVSDEELADLYARAWAFCLPSSYEGFGIPYAEAMASRLPVVATPNPGSRFVTDEGRAGILVDDDRLGPELLDLLRDDARRGDLATRGWERSREFSLERVVSAYEDLYRDVLRERRGGA